MITDTNDGSLNISRENLNASIKAQVNVYRLAKSPFATVLIPKKPSDTDEHVLNILAEVLDYRPEIINIIQQSNRAPVIDAKKFDVVEYTTLIITFKLSKPGR